MCIRDRNGMEIICRILKEASRILTDDGILIMEVSPSQIQYFGELKEKELSLISVCRDINGIERFVVLAKRISIC
ncbi:MAG: hypothetical protein N2115_04270, partial [bacterium]|nr:hypothetical protein [bacterium]